MREIPGSIPGAALSCLALIPQALRPLALSTPRQPIEFLARFIFTVAILAQGTLGTVASLQASFLHHLNPTHHWMLCTSSSSRRWLHDAKAHGIRGRIGIWKRDLLCGKRAQSSDSDSHASASSATRLVQLIARPGIAQCELRGGKGRLSCQKGLGIACQCPQSSSG